VEAFQGARLTPASKNCVQHHDSRRCELGRSEYHWHQWGFVHQLDLRASKALMWSSQLEDLGGLSTFEDSPSIGTLFADGSGLIS
jgi:hypothetical protein